VAAKATPGAGKNENFIRNVFYASLIVVGVVALAALVWQAAHYLLLFFAGILLAILLDAIASGIGAIAPLPRPARLLMAVLIVAAAFGAIVFVIPSVIAQAPELARYLQEWLEWFRANVMTLEPVRETLENGQSEELVQLLPSPGELLGGAAAIVGGTISILTGVVLIVIFGLYLAAEPSRYYEQGIAEFTPGLRQKLAATGADIGTVLRRWLLAQILMMLLIGFSSYAVLTALGVPLALMLSFIAGMTAFIPFVGPLIGGSAMVLVAATKDAWLGLIVIGFYIGLQLVESYLLTPMIQSRAIFVPPAIVILAQVILGVLFGALGIALATPLAAVIAVIVKRHFLGRPVGAEQAG
jgi:predicted PurR-regulated permease PerM